jgi:DNA repair exonuclease SbcCD ATPase subunit
MNKTFKTLAIIIFLMNSHFFFAQQVIVDQKAQEIELKRAENEAKKTSAENHRRLDDKISELKKQQKELESKKKKLVKSENNLKSTKEKINKLELANQKTENKITTTSISDEEITKQRIKIKENEVSVQKLKLTQISQQKDLEKVMATL